MRWPQRASRWHWMHRCLCAAFLSRNRPLSPACRWRCTARWMRRPERLLGAHGTGARGLWHVAQHCPGPCSAMEPRDNLPGACDHEHAVVAALALYPDLPSAQTTCAHPPFTFNGGVRSAAWDSCMAQNLTRTIDSGAAQLPAHARMSCVHKRCGGAFGLCRATPLALACGSVGSGFNAHTVYPPHSIMSGPGTAKKWRGGG